MKPEIISYKTGEKEEIVDGKPKKVDITTDVSMNFPEDLDEMVKMWGADLVYNKAKAQIVIDARRLCYEAENPETAQQMIDQFTPGVSRRASGGSSVKALAAQLAELKKTDPAKAEEIMAMLASLKTA